MAFWKTINQIKNTRLKETPEESRAREIERLKCEQERQRAEEEQRASALSSLKSLEPNYLELQQKAHDEKDKIMYSYSTGALFFFDNVEALTSEMKLYEIDSVIDFFNELLTGADVEKMHKLMELCNHFSKVNLRQYRVHPDVDFTNYTISDVIGIGIRMLQDSDYNDVYNIFK